MKYIVILTSCIFLVVLAGLLPVIGSDTMGQKASGPGAAAPAEQVTWEVPIAAGIYYPGDGPVPDKPVRYYRVRCWPGCHSGSTLGKYPDKALKDKPIFPTSTIDGHTKAVPSKE
jgi:hypothetical protein